MEGHPLMVAIGIFAIFFVFYQYIRRKSSPTALGSAVPVTNPTYYDYSTATYTTTNPGPVGPPGPIGKPGPVGPPGPAPVPPRQPPQPSPAPVPSPAPKPTTAQYVTVQPWPAQLSTLWGISQYVHKSLPQIEALNPQYSSNWNLIYAGQKVRVS